MTAPDTQGHAQVADPSSSIVEETAPPPPEPWTPQRALEWNRYYDIYVAAGALLLILVASVHPINNASLWSELQTGRLIAVDGPVTTDVFSYTMAGTRWVDIPWLYQLVQARIFEVATGFSATEPEQAATTTIILLNAFLRMLTAGVLLMIRRPGPGGWWVAFCVVLAFGGMLMPFPGGTDSLILPVLGGIAGSAEVDSETWGILLLAIEVLLLTRAARGSRAALIGLIPLFLLWANIDESFLIGLILFGVRALASLFERRSATVSDEPRKVGPAWWLGVLVASAAATLVNPWTWEIYPIALAPLLNLFQPTGELTYNQLSFFGSESWAYYDRILGALGGYRLYIAYYVVLVGAGLASFVLNKRRFSLGLFLMFVAAAVLWGAVRAYAPIFAVVFAVSLALNGQQWYQDRFGVQGRLGPGWALWSIGGRAVTLVVIFALIFKGLTGVWASPSELPFGVGMNAEEIAFEAAEYLGESPIQGNILNVRLDHGDALIWKAWPLNRTRRTFMDGRPHLFPPSLLDERLEIQRALAEDRREAWQPKLDEYGITVVMVPMLNDPFGQRLMYAAMSRSDDWIAFYDDGGVVLFGRADAPEADLAIFRANMLDPEQLAFQAERAVQSSDRVPTATSWVDGVFPNRRRRMPQPHVGAAQRWLTIRKTDPNQLPGLANCLLAIAEARAALAIDPDDPAAWNVLGEAYEVLAIREGEILNAANPETPPVSYIQLRLQQRLAVLNFAVQATPPPANEEARLDLAAMHEQIARVYLSQGYLDVARDRLASSRNLAGSASFPQNLELTLAQLEESIASLETELSDLMSTQQISPVQAAQFALSRGAPGIAIRELEQAEQAGINPELVKAQLVDLYCQVGMPEKALDLISAGTIEDPALSTGPGSASYRQALVYFLIGSYDLTASVWGDRSIPQLRATMVYDTLGAAVNFIQGQPREAADALLPRDGRPSITERLSTEATWLYQLGLCLLESGKPADAALAFQNALEVDEDLPVAPLLRAYLDRIGLPETPAEDGTAPDEPEPAARPGLPAVPAVEAPEPAPEPADDKSTESTSPDDPEPADDSDSDNTSSPD